MDSKKDDDILLGLIGVFNIVGLKKIFWSNWISKTPIVLSLLTVVLIKIFNINTYLLIKEITNSIISFLPGILGFTVAGYTLVVGFVQNEIAKKISIKREGKKYTLYQTISATFALNIITQAFGLIFGFLVHFIIFFDENKTVPINISNKLIDYINVVGLIIISYWFIFTLLLTIQVIVNVFNFSQLYHYFTTNEIKQDNKKTKK